ncbi:precorrin-2/cobalt-factor-2 C20-methyltransferase [Rhizobium sp. BK529]|uniref:precorrin-2 C(20)-methyltransferase n=1 Tax=unclassified Rhizobium TaxID=2613769 RepID=UPI00104AE979|nr:MULTISPECIES: precorrin-2 C(20)-methyltransferase [unclassified Rhizobium]MBB3593854.1 precorrin-2/cobalt-factor-2 C20-methyltransferase [Rhizobium sp. BK529]TCS01311.1 precorrin-2 C20-methyltransferase [Rhizobium sp. BK418]
MSGSLIGVGTGPGDPELLTLKAVRAIESADVIAYFAKRGRGGNGKAIVENLLKPGVELLPLYYPVTTEIDKNDPLYQRRITDFYNASAEAVARHLDAGRRVAVLSEGDPLFYGSYMHLHVRLSQRYPTQVIPGISAMSGCWSSAGMPIVQGDDVLSVLPGTMAEQELTRRLTDTEAAVIMKVGRNLPKIRRALQAAGRLDDALYVERGTMANAAMVKLSERDETEAPYFSLVLVPGWEARR